MKIGVITPYHETTSPYFSQCLDSVQRQTYNDLIHVVVGDGCNAQGLNQYKKVHHIPLPANINDFGDSPRSIGVIYAFALGADAVMFLDSDNWYSHEHVASMVDRWQTSGCDVITCHRHLVQLDGSFMGRCPESNGIIFCDTNCLMVTKNLAEEAGLWWLIPEDMHVIDDRVMWDTLIHATDRISSTGSTTVYYRTAYEFHYRMFGLAPPAGCKTGQEIAAVGDVINSLQIRAKQRAIERTSTKNS